MGEVVFGVDFRAKRDRQKREQELQDLAAYIFGTAIVLEGFTHDYAPSEYSAPVDDPA